MVNRRKSGERRSFGRSEIFPFTDKNGCVLHKSRSRTPDRRLNSLEVAWIPMALVHDDLVAQHKISQEGLIIKAAPRAKRVKG
ncbi:MAG: hypothetical protein OEV12_05985 [Gammaproteobacteria bacterium]|jgi:hypothetical protein|nr:hypothetical protein [Gammaproteobacteria bacterium]MDH3887728.1 hypothetical protein [Gammaproteobacteria bacterium]MDH3935656.1 hypothetical protein [Gammaproteobacteria bacterium]MDH3971395.1 hypothetical protein [Gammaproteobacteria bacterium]MDH3985950.1 hypothetical protein [Gammaproteobacteria bacterium]